MIRRPEGGVDRLDPIFRCTRPGLGDIPAHTGPEDGRPPAERGISMPAPPAPGIFVKMVHNASSTA